MNRKILLSVGVMVFVAALVISATGAFFTDKETSAGNIFTAGSIDLKVDHTRQTYNGVDCKTCQVEVVSDTTNMVVGKNGSPVVPFNAMAVTFIHPAWTASIPGATWIWATDPVTQQDVVNDAIYVFEKQFDWFGPFLGATVEFAVAADNSYEVWLNGVKIHEDTAENNHGAADSVVIPNLNQGTNTLRFTVKNWAQPNGNPQTNPAGLLYKLTINGNCGDDYFKNHCSLFGESDLTGQKFWNFDDVKPGDWGSNLISLHVYDNDAHVCLLTHDIESTPEDPNLPKYIKTAAWMSDVDGTKGDPLVLSPLQDSNVQLKVKATTTEYVLVEWCFGNWVGDKCDGKGNYNDAQGESVSLSMTAYAIQQRHNENFVCSTDLLKPEQPEDKDE